MSYPTILFLSQIPPPQFIDLDKMEQDPNHSEHVFAFPEPNLNDEVWQI